MRDLAMSDHGVQEWQSAIRGARTLEWCEANDPDVTDECTDRIEELKSAITDIRAAMTAWNTSSSSKKRHEDLRQEMAEILAEVGL